MGLPIDKLICASNENKVLCDFLSTGQYDISNRKFITTISPSMDILISSNLERLLYHISGRDGELVSFLMDQLKKKGRFEIPDGIKDNLKDFYGGFADDSLTGMSISQVFGSYGYLKDTHTSVAYSVLKRYRDITKDSTRTIIVSTASPYKFTSAVMNSIDINYRGINSFELLTEMSRLGNGEIPKPLRDLETSPVIHNIICSSSEMKSITADILRL
jgi:threonine synthase